MSEIRVARLSPREIESMGIPTWPIWEKEVSEFPWDYDERERCLFLEGRVRVTPEGGTPVEIGPGDFVTFPAGMHCVWTVLEPVRKHYAFG